MPARTPEEPESRGARRRGRGTAEDGGGGGGETGEMRREQEMKGGTGGIQWRRKRRESKRENREREGRKAWRIKWENPGNGGKSREVGERERSRLFDVVAEILSFFFSFLFLCFFPSYANLL